MKIAYLVFLVVAGAALVKAASKEWPNCIDFYLPPPETEKINCPRCQVEAIAAHCGNPSTFVPVCDGEVFAKYQYDPVKNEHFCYYTNGEEIPESRAPEDVDPSVCDAYPDVDPASVAVIESCEDKKAKLGTIGTFISCEAEGEWEGFFSPEQKNGIYSWCSSPDGVMIPDTFTVAPEEPADCIFFRNLRPVCPGEGNFPVDWDCTRYISCCPLRVPHLCSCQPGLAWDVKLKVCNNIEEVERCAKPELVGFLKDVEGMTRGVSGTKKARILYR